MDIEKLIERLKKASADGSWNTLADYAHKAATALSTLQAENEKLKDQLYDGEGVNLVDYWMQQAQIEERGHRNCQAENENLRAENIMHRNAASNYYAELEEYKDERNEALAELEQVKAERDAAVEDIAGILAKVELIRREIGYRLDYKSDNKLADLCIDYCKNNVCVRCYEEREDGGCINFLWRGHKED